MTNRDLSILCMDYLLRRTTQAGPQLAEMYLDFTEDFLTTAQTAEHAELDIDLLEVALSYGKDYQQATKGREVNIL
jgi:hypothetical protein